MKHVDAASWDLGAYPTPFQGREELPSRRPVAGLAHLSATRFGWLVLLGAAAWAVPISFVIAIT